MATNRALRVHRPWKDARPGGPARPRPSIPRPHPYPCQLSIECRRGNAEGRDLGEIRLYVRAGREPHNHLRIVGPRSSGAPGVRSTTRRTTLPARGGRPGNAQSRVSACWARERGGTARDGPNRLAKVDVEGTTLVGRGPSAVTQCRFTGAVCLVASTSKSVSNMLPTIRAVACFCGP